MGGTQGRGRRRDSASFSPGDVVYRATVSRRGLLLPTKNNHNAKVSHQNYCYRKTAQDTFVRSSSVNTLSSGAASSNAFSTRNKNHCWKRPAIPIMTAPQKK